MFIKCPRIVENRSYFRGIILLTCPKKWTLVESGEWDRVDIRLEPPNDHDFDSAKDSGDEDFGSTLKVYLSGRSWKLNV